MTLSGWQWLVAALCAVLVGVAKTGVPGLGILVVPVLSLTFADGLGSAGFLLPLLIVADVFAVGYYRRHAQVNRLWELAPWVLAGMALGGGAMFLPESLFRGHRDTLFTMVIGVVVLAMIAVYWRQKGRSQIPVPGDLGHVARYGLAAGFATTLANAAGPVMNLYLLSQRLPKEEFIATGAWYFLVINLAKVPIYVACGTITWQSLGHNAWLAPAVVLGALSGRRIFERIPARTFERTVFALAGLAALLLLIPR